ncbi:MAG: hypothetical protein H6797_04615 [Candidatus Nomurabacteria bacterium]|nr:MAG: hypothetical protein H6797_04615 [Candidatus Nomurabacteria bacterium]
MAKNHEYEDQNVYPEGALEADTRRDDVRVVTLCELGRLVLLEYTKKEFWINTIEMVGGIEGLVLGGIKKLL